MTDAPTSEMTAKSKRVHKPQLRVVFDTNALYVTPTSLGSASDLLREDIASLILESKYPDLEILWYLPEAVRHERQYQMESEALKLRGAINKIERLLGHNLALTDKHLLDHVKTKIDDKVKELGLREIKLDFSTIDWGALINAALYRKAPFQSGEKEKGFKDALVLESFAQVLATSPKTPNACRVVFVTSDRLLADAAKERITGRTNASVIAGIEGLRGLINTLISNVSEDFIEQLKPRASKLFFVSADNNDTLYFTKKIGEQIREKYRDALTKTPEGTTRRTNKTWYIGEPNFSRKDGKRIYWTSRVEVEVEAGITVKQSAPKLSNLSSLLTLSSLKPGPSLENQGSIATSSAPSAASGMLYSGQAADWGSAFGETAFSYLDIPDKTVVTQKGSDAYEVLWSVELTTNKKLRKGEIHEIRHAGLNTQAV